MLRKFRSADPCPQSLKESPQLQRCRAVRSMSLRSEIPPFLPILKRLSFSASTRYRHVKHAGHTGWHRVQSSKQQCKILRILTLFGCNIAKGLIIARLVQALCTWIDVRRSVLQPRDPAGERRCKWCRGMECRLGMPRARRT